MHSVLIAGAVRTAIGDLNGSLSALSAVELGKAAAAEALRRSGVLAEAVDEVIAGNVLQAGLGQNPARQISIGIGLSNVVPAFTVNKVCGSGMKAMELGWQSILLDRALAVLAVGTESMSQAPYLLPALRQGARLGDVTAVDSAVHDGLSDVFGQYHMGITAENIAWKLSIDREEQDVFAISSHRRCAQAMERGLFEDEIVPVEVKGRKQTVVVAQDEHPRPDTSLDKLAKLATVFKKDGTVTAGNASGINDGAAAVMLVSADSTLAESIPAGQAVRLRDIAVSGCAPELMGLGPVGATNKLLSRHGLTTNDIDVWELNEAFAVQSIAVLRELRLDPAKVNVNGGAIALGHPIGASGTRIVVTLIHQMKRQNATLGVATMCIGGGMGIAALLENV